MHHATSRNVAGSIPNEVIRFFNYTNYTHLSPGVGSIFKRNGYDEYFWGKRGRCVYVTTICEPTVYKILEPRRLATLWDLTTCYMDSLTSFYPKMLHVRYVDRYEIHMSYPVPISLVQRSVNKCQTALIQRNRDGVTETEKQTRLAHDCERPMVRL
jgi:hypothetical protein